MTTPKVVSGTEPNTLHFCSRPIYRSPPKKPSPETISFSSHIPNSRFSIRNPSTRPGTRIHAVYAPAEITETLYQVLGISETAASLSDVKKAYKEMARKYHPDVSPPDRVDEYTRRFIMVHEAYETLSDPHSRAVYDGELALGGLASAFAAKKSRQRREETGEWKKRWESQLEDLKRRRSDNGRMTWGARMRSQRT